LQRVHADRPAVERIDQDPLCGDRLAGVSGYLPNSRQRPLRYL
jgi:hypothetical protein